MTAKETRGKKKAMITIYILIYIYISSDNYIYTQPQCNSLPTDSQLTVELPTNNTHLTHSNPQHWPPPPDISPQLCGLLCGVTEYGITPCLIMTSCAGNG